MRYLNFKDIHTHTHTFLRPVHQKGLETMINPESVKTTKAQTLASVEFLKETVTIERNDQFQVKKRK